MLKQYLAIAIIFFVLNSDLIYKYDNTNKIIEKISQ